MRKKINGKVYNICPGADLCGADLSGANLGCANLSYAKFRGANLRGANLIYAKFSGANLRGANLSGANLSDANFSGADLSNANLSGANLYGANFYGANFSGAIFSGAIFSGAIFGGADLSNANLNGAEGYRNSHAVFQELCSRCDNDFFTITEWGQIAAIVVKKWCWSKIISWQPALASSVFWKLHGKGWTEFYKEYIKKGGERHANDNMEHHTTIV